VARFSTQIVTAFTHPRNVGELASPDASAVVADPVCGDQVHLTLRIAEGRIVDARFRAYGCAAALGTASILTEWVIGMAPAELLHIDEAAVTGRVGGLSPRQSHCAKLAVDVLRTLAAHCPPG
jgi:NifU-like protein involved in Fe-S cluster formation